MPTTSVPVLAWIAFTLTPAVAAAYQTGSPVAVECHERMTRFAVSEARRATNTDKDRPITADERALEHDLPFETDSDDGYGTWIAVLANRSLDFGGNEATALDSLAQVHGAEQNQKEHCLRRTTQDGVAGAKAALEECHAYIREQAELAIQGLDSSGRVMRDARIEFPATLSIRGNLDLDAPRFYVGMGRALHTIQDSFSHSYRTPDDLRITTILNYAEIAEAQHDVEIDGPAHSGVLDECSNLDDFRNTRLQMARQASIDFVTVLYDRNLTADEKRAGVEAFLTNYLSYEPGCDYSNAWCDAPELEFQDSEPVTCSDAGAPNRGGLAGLALGAGLLGLLVLRARRRRRRWLPLALVVFGAIATTPDRAEANDFGLYVSGSGAILNTAAATSVGGRYALSENWVLGLDGEWNPWLNGTDSVRSGVVNVYGTVIFRVPLEDDNLNLRTTLQLGATRMMFDLVGVPEGSIGPYIGFNPLGLEWRVGPELYVIIDPAHISVPVPQFTNVPFAFPQYRVTLGLQWGGFDR